MRREKTHTSINIAITLIFLKLLQEAQKITGDPYSQMIAMGLDLLTPEEIEAARGDPYGSEKRQKVFSVTFETADKLEALHRSSGKTKTSLVQTALYAYLQRGTDRPVFDKPNPLLAAMNDRILIDELRVRGYRVTKS
jgi:hypothetical protein